MLTLLKYIQIEEQDAQQIFTPVQVKGIVERDCKPFVDAIGGPQYIMKKGHSLYRGIRNSPITLGGLTRRDVRKDRRPKDSSQQFHQLLDDYFVRKVGIPLRSVSLFTLSDPSTATAYGMPHIVFPIGNFQTFWIPGVHDITTQFEDVLVPQRWNVSPSNIISSLIMYGYGNIQDYKEIMRDSIERAAADAQAQAVKYANWRVLSYVQRDKMETKIRREQDDKINELINLFMAKMRAGQRADTAVRNLIYYGFQKRIVSYVFHSASLTDTAIQERIESTKLLIDRTKHEYLGLIDTQHERARRALAILDDIRVGGVQEALHENAEIMLVCDQVYLYRIPTT